MSSRTSLEGQDSALFNGKVGTTCSNREFHPDNISIGQSEPDSDGMWAFCRFDHSEILAVRVGFQKGGFNITDSYLPINPSVLQLHLEIMTAEGGLVWLPTGVFHGEDVIIEPDEINISLYSDSAEIFSISGWPEMKWHFQSLDESIEANLEFTIGNTTILPDCILPYCTFAMWLGVSEVSGWVRIKNKTAEVKGTVFLDHPRIRHGLPAGNVRKSYLYTPLSLTDNSFFCCYYAEDQLGDPIPYYCFATYIDSDGEYFFSTGTELLTIEFDDNSLPKFWELKWTDGNNSVHAKVSAKEHKLAKIWGSPDTPKSLKEFIYYPLVLDCSAVVTGKGKRKEVTGIGLAEYFKEGV